MDKEWNKMKLVDLKAFAKGKIPGYTMMNKERLVAALVKSKLPLPSAGATAVPAPPDVAPVAPAPAPKIKKIKKTIKYAKALVEAEIAAKAVEPKKKKMTKKAMLLERATALPEVLVTKIGEYIKPKPNPVRLPMPLMKELGKALTFLEERLKEAKEEEDSDSDSDSETDDDAYTTPTYIKREIKALKAIAKYLSETYHHERHGIDILPGYRSFWNKRDIWPSLRDDLFPEYGLPNGFDLEMAGKFFMGILIKPYDPFTFNSDLQEMIEGQLPEEFHFLSEFLIEDEEQGKGKSICYLIRFKMLESYKGFLFHALDKMDQDVFRKYFRIVAGFTNKTGPEKLETMARVQRNKYYKAILQTISKKRKIPVKHLSEETKRSAMTSASERTEGYFKDKYSTKDAIKELFKKTKAYFVVEIIAKESTGTNVIERTRPEMEEVD